MHRPLTIWKDFSDFFCNYTYYRLLDCVEFNIHVCCPIEPMVSEFTQLPNSFNYVQSINETTYYQGQRICQFFSFVCGIEDLSLLF